MRYPGLLFTGGPIRFVGGPLHNQVKFVPEWLLELEHVYVPECTMVELYGVESENYAKNLYWERVRYSLQKMRLYSIIFFEYRFEGITAKQHLDSGDLSQEFPLSHRARTLLGIHG